MLRRNPGKPPFVILEDITADSEGLGSVNLGKSQSQTLAAYASGDVSVNWRQGNPVRLDCDHIVKNSLIPSPS